MYFQYLIEDASTEILVGEVMKKLQDKYPGKEIIYDTKSFSGIGHLRTSGNLMERKGGNLLNNLHIYLRGFDRSLSSMPQSAIIVVLDNDNRNYDIFKSELEQVANESVMLVVYAFCIAVKEMEAWLLGDEAAIGRAYPAARKKYIKAYEQDGMCDTWETLANAVYPGGLPGLRKKAKSRYSEIGRAKCEWAEKIGKELVLEENSSPSFRKFLNELQCRIETV